MAGTVPAMTHDAEHASSSDVESPDPGAADAALRTAAMAGDARRSRQPNRGTGYPQRPDVPPTPGASRMFAVAVQAVVASHGAAQEPLPPPQLMLPAADAADDASARPQQPMQLMMQQPTPAADADDDAAASDPDADFFTKRCWAKACSKAASGLRERKARRISVTADASNQTPAQQTAAPESDP